MKQILSISALILFLASSTAFSQTVFTARKDLIWNQSPVVTGVTFEVINSSISNLTTQSQILLDRLNTNKVYQLWGATSNQTFVTVNGADLDVWGIGPGLHPRIYFSPDFKAVTQPTPGVYVTNTPPQTTYEYPFDDGDWHGALDSGQNAVVFYQTMDAFWISFTPPTEFPQTLEGVFSVGVAYGTATISNVLSNTTLSTNRIAHIKGGSLTDGGMYPNALGISTTNALWAGIINSLASERSNWNVVTNRTYTSGNTDGLTGNSNTLFYGCSWLVSDPYDTIYISGDGSDIKTVFIGCSLKNTASGDLIATPTGWDVEAYDCTFIQEGTNTVPGLPECAGFHVLGKLTMFQCAIVQTNSPNRTLSVSTLSTGVDKYLDSCTAISGTNIKHFGSSPVYVNNCTGFVGEPTGTFTSTLATDIRLGKRYIMSEAINAVTLSNKVSMSSGTASNLTLLGDVKIGATNLQTLLDAKLNTNGNGSALTNIPTTAIVSLPGVISNVETLVIWTNPPTAGTYALASDVNTKPSFTQMTNAIFYNPVITYTPSVTSTVTVIPSVNIYRVVSTSAVTTVVFDKTAISATSNNIATWETRIDFQYTNAPLTLVLSGVTLASPVDITCFGEYRFAMEYDGATLRCSQIYPVLYDWSPLRWAAGGADVVSLWRDFSATTTNGISFYNNISSPHHQLVYLSVRCSANWGYGSFSITAQSDYRAAWGIERSLYYVSVTNMLSSGSVDILVVVPPVALTDPQTITIWSFPPNNSITRIQYATPRSRRLNDLEVRAYALGWRPFN